eukprot:795432_1
MKHEHKPFIFRFNPQQLIPHATMAAHKFRTLSSWFGDRTQLTFLCINLVGGYSKHWYQTACSNGISPSLYTSHLSLEELKYEGLYCVSGVDDNDCDKNTEQQILYSNVNIHRTMRDQYQLMS